MILGSLSCSELLLERVWSVRIIEFTVYGVRKSALCPDREQVRCSKCRFVVFVVVVVVSITVRVRFIMDILYNDMLASHVIRPGSLLSRWREEVDPKVYFQLVGHDIRLILPWRWMAHSR